MIFLKSIRWILLIAAFVTSNSLIASSEKRAPSPQSREYHLKGAFLRYVANFVQWPTQALPEDKINICVIGQIPSFKGISSIHGKIVQSRAITISKIIEPYEAKNRCQMLFVSKTEENRIDKIITTLNGLPILSFGDMDGFAAKGGDMNFYTLNNRLAIMINPPAVERAKLKISPRMLKVVTVMPLNNISKPITN